MNKYFLEALFFSSLFFRSIVFAGPVPIEASADIDNWTHRFPHLELNNSRSLAERSLFAYDQECKPQLHQQCDFGQLENFSQLESAASVDDFLVKIDTIVSNNSHDLLAVYVFLRMNQQERVRFFENLRNALYRYAESSSVERNLKAILSDQTIFFGLFEYTPEARWEELVVDVLIPLQVRDVEWWGQNMEASTKTLAYRDLPLQYANWNTADWESYYEARNEKLVQQISDIQTVMERGGEPVRIVKAMYAERSAPSEDRVVRIAEGLRGDKNTRLIALDFIQSNESPDFWWGSVSKVLSCRHDHVVYGEILREAKYLPSGLIQALSTCMESESELYTSFSVTLVVNGEAWVMDERTDSLAFYNLLKTMRLPVRVGKEVRVEARRLLGSLRMRFGLVSIRDIEDPDQRLSAVSELISVQIPVDQMAEFIAQARMETLACQEEEWRVRALLGAYLHSLSTQELAPDAADEALRLARSVFDLAPDELSDPGLELLLKSLRDTGHFTGEDKDVILAMLAEF